MKTFEEIKDIILKWSGEIIWIAIYWSRLSNDIDDFSDTDIIVVKSNLEHISENNIKSFWEIVAIEKSINKNSKTYRFITDSFERYDITFMTSSKWEKENIKSTVIYWDIKSNYTKENSNFKNPELPNNNINFLFFEAIKKLKRWDNLIAVHLIMEIYQEYLVLKMIKRDIKYKTSVHRFWENEQIDLINKIDFNNNIQILNLAKNLAIKIQNISKEIDSGNFYDMTCVIKYINKVLVNYW